MGLPIKLNPDNMSESRVPTDCAGQNPISAGGLVGSSDFRWVRPLEPQEYMSRWEVQSLETGERHVAEVIDPLDDEFMLALLTNAVFTERRTRHANIANVLAAGWLKGGAFFHVLALAPLEKPWFDQHSQRAMSESNFLKAASRLISALVHMHKSDVVHASINKDSLRLSNSQILLSDLWWAGTSSGISLHEPLYNYYPINLSDSALLCVAPEVLLGEKPAQEADLFSLGCVFFFMLTLDYPRRTSGLELDSPHGLDRLARSGIQTLSTLRPDIDRELAATIQSMLELDPEKRLHELVVADRLQQFASVAESS